MDKNVCACRSVAEAFQQSQVMWDSLRGISSFEVGINRLCEGHGNGQSILGSQCHRARAARRPWEKEKEAEIQLCWLSCGSDFLNTAESGLGRFDHALMHLRSRNIHKMKFHKVSVANVTNQQSVVFQVNRYRHGVRAVCASAAFVITTHMGRHSGSQICWSTIWHWQVMILKSTEHGLKHCTQAAVLQFSYWTAPLGPPPLTLGTTE